MHRFARLAVAGALLAGTAVFLPASPASAATQINSCTGAPDAGTATDAGTGLVLVANRNLNLNTASGPLTCTPSFGGSGVTGATFATNFTGWNGLNCNTIMGKSSFTVPFTATWTVPTGMGNTAGTARATVASRTTTSTTLTVTGRFADTGGHLYRTRPFTATIVLDKSFYSTGLGGDCVVVGNGLQSFTTTVTLFKVWAA